MYGINYAGINYAEGRQSSVGMEWAESSEGHGSSDGAEVEVLAQSGLGRSSIHPVRQHSGQMVRVSSENNNQPKSLLKRIASLITYYGGSLLPESIMISGSQAAHHYFGYRPSDVERYRLFSLLGVNKDIDLSQYEEGNVDKIIRELQIRCHPDKYQDASEKERMTQTFTWLAQQGRKVLRAECKSGRMKGMAFDVLSHAVRVGLMVDVKDHLSVDGAYDLLGFRQNEVLTKATVRKRAKTVQHEYMMRDIQSIQNGGAYKAGRILLLALNILLVKISTPSIDNQKLVNIDKFFDICSIRGSQISTGRVMDKRIYELEVCRELLVESSHH